MGGGSLDELDDMVDRRVFPKVFVDVNNVRSNVDIKNITVC